MSLIILIACKNDKIDKFDGAEIVFHADGRTAAYIGGDGFEKEKANKLNSQGVELAKKGDFQGAKDKFLKGLEVEPKNATLLNNLGNSEHELRNYHEATSLFEKSLMESDSSYLNAGLNLGLLYWKDYEFKKSAKILEYVLLNSKRDYEIAMAQFQLAKTYLDMNNCAKAKKALLSAKSYLSSISGFKEKLKNLDVEIKNCVQHGV